MITVQGFVSHAFDETLYEGGRDAFKRYINDLVELACREFESEGASVGFSLFYDAIEVGRPLLSEIRRRIRECDFVIADITPGSYGVSQVNPNVMYELGYAMALEKRVLIIRRATSTLPPSDIRDLLAGTYHTLADIPTNFADAMERIISGVLIDYSGESSRLAPLIHSVWFPPETAVINIVCSPEPERSKFCDANEANYLHIDNFEDRDALFDLSTFFARQYPRAQVVRHLCSAISTDALNGNLVVLGGPGCVADEGNSVGRELMQMLNSTVTYPEEGDGLRYGQDDLRLSKYDEHERPVEDWGAILAAQNPYNPSARVVLLHGVLTYGTLAAATALIDTRPAIRNHVQLATLDLTSRHSGAAQFECLVKAEIGVGNRIRPPVIDGPTVRRLNA